MAFYHFLEYWNIERVKWLGKYLLFIIIWLAYSYWHYNGWIWYVVEDNVKNNSNTASEAKILFSNNC